MKQIGPNVSISANARIGPGARLISCIILDDVQVMVGTELMGLKCSRVGFYVLLHKEI